MLEAHKQLELDTEQSRCQTADKNMKELKQCEDKKLRDNIHNP